MSDLRRAVAEYLSIRRSMGFKLVQAERLLADFVTFAESEGATRVSTDLALRWATKPADASLGWWKSRLCVIRCFARHLSAVDPSTELPPLDLLPRTPTASGRATPYIYSPAEITALMGATSSARSEFTATMCRTLVGLLACTGMRVGEALRLDNGDIDWIRGVLIVRQSKLDRSREIPLHHSTVEALRAYSAARDERYVSTSTAAVFVSWSGGRLSYGAIRWHFARMVRAAGLHAKSTGCRPRLHDFRHSFACATLEDWHRAGVDVQSRLPMLSTYLGHIDPASTYWYLSATPELLAAAAVRLENRLGVLP